VRRRRETGEAATSKADPRRKQYWVVKGLQGGWRHSAAHPWRCWNPKPEPPRLNPCRSSCFSVRIRQLFFQLHSAGWVCFGLAVPEGLLTGGRRAVECSWEGSVEVFASCLPRTTRATHHAAYGDAKVANRDIRVWHGAIEKGP
jgi:hypothetical protein